MFWVVQNNIYSERNHTLLMETLNDMDIPHAEIKVAPFADKLLPADFDSHNFNGNIDQIEEAEIDDSAQVIAMGGITLARLGKERGWAPGSFLNENYHYNRWLAAYGEHLLNHQSLVELYKNIDPKWDEFFIRPCEDTKSFDGKVYTRREFDVWREEVLGASGDCKFADDQVVASPAQKINAEFRFFVVDGNIATQSQYKLGAKIHADEQVDEETTAFAKKMADLWQPARAFVIDIAKTSEGLKVVEINNFNSAGFYACDVVKIVAAVENMKY